MIFSNWLETSILKVVALFLMAVLICHKKITTAIKARFNENILFNWASRVMYMFVKALRRFCVTTT